MSRFDSMMKHLKAHADGADDRKLIALFEKHRAIVSEHYQNCIPAEDGSDYWQWTPAVCPLREFHGPMFHKGFRQFDVTSSGKDDMAIWHLLRGNTTNFWQAHRHSMRKRRKVLREGSLPDRANPEGMSAEGIEPGPEGARPTQG